MSTAERPVIQRNWRFAIGGLGFFVAIGFLLITEHRAHMIQILPWVIVLACPLLHMFMHGGHGHGGHGGSHGHASRARDRDEAVRLEEPR